MRKFFLFSTLLISCLFLGCDQERFPVDTEQVTAKPKVFRFDKLLFTKPPTQVQQEALQHYPDFFTPFVSEVIRVGRPNTPKVLEGLQKFATDEDILAIKEDVDKAFLDFSTTQSEFEQALRRYNYFFPNRVVPNVVTYISGFNYANVATDSCLGVGLDMYLGEEYSYYIQLRFPRYKRKLLSEKYMVPHALENWIRTEFSEPEKETMLAKLIYEGKVMLALEALLPGYPDSIRFRYSKSQMEWATQNEFNVWAYLVDEELLYSSVFTDYYKFFKEAPFTASLARESPPRMGQ